jgi:hypothetical protein
MSMERHDDLRYGRPEMPRHYGKYAGHVIDTAPQSGAARGEIVARLPGLLEETPDGGASQPMEVRAAPALPPGFFFTPEKDDTVWVEFVDGDVNFPIWTGVWYAQDKPPRSSAGEAPTQDQKVIRAKGGLVIEMNGAGGSEKIVIKDETNGSTITLDSSGVTIDAGKGLVLKCGQTSLTISDGRIELAGSGATLKVAATVAVS